MQFSVLSDLNKRVRFISVACCRNFRNCAGNNVITCQPFAFVEAVFHDYLLIWL